jgi:hypothetical protein
MESDLRNQDAMNTSPVLPTDVPEGEAILGGQASQQVDCALETHKKR